MARGADEYKKWHWGIPHSMEVEWDDDDLPEYLVECGRFKEFHYVPVNNNPRRKDQVYSLTKTQSQNSHLCFDPNHRYQRLYILLNPSVQKKAKKRFWTNNEYKEVPLKELAKAAGGKHATSDYPDVMVRPIGVMTNVVYHTHKKGDDPASFYIHHMGEETGIQPYLGCDSTGRIWIAGGDYTSPTPGITN